MESTRIFVRLDHHRTTQRIVLVHSTEPRADGEVVRFVLSDGESEDPEILQRMSSTRSLDPPSTRHPPDISRSSSAPLGAPESIASPSGSLVAADDEKTDALVPKTTEETPAGPVVQISSDNQVSTLGHLRSKAKIQHIE